jgi:hypothetical protein
VRVYLVAAGFLSLYACDEGRHREKPLPVRHRCVQKDNLGSRIAVKIAASGRNQVGQHYAILASTAGTPLKLSQGKWVERYRGGGLAAGAARSLAGRVTRRVVRLRAELALSPIYTQIFGRIRTKHGLRDGFFDYNYNHTVNVTTWFFQLQSTTVRPTPPPMVPGHSTPSIPRRSCKELWMLCPLRTLTLPLRT